MNSALQGIKVIDFSQWLPGQYCGMFCATIGARHEQLEPGAEPEQKRNYC